MKLSDFTSLIKETPHLMFGKYDDPTIDKGEAFVSSLTLGRMTHLGDLPVTDEKMGKFDLKFYAESINVFGVKPGVHNKNGEMSNQIVCRIQTASHASFEKIPNEFKSRRVLQISEVYLHKNFRNQGIIANVYCAMADTGSVIISDKTQFTDGANLWKRIARIAVSQNLKVQVFNGETGEFLRTADGKFYDGTNIPDERIWSKGSNSYGVKMLLALYR